MHDDSAMMMRHASSVIAILPVAKFDEKVSKRPPAPIFLIFDDSTPKCDASCKTVRPTVDTH